MRDTALLLLEDGSLYEGEALGAAGIAVGELVFSTATVGYQQLLTTPACAGQLLTMTSPLVGNVGVSQESAESPRVCAAGLIVRECDSHPSNFRCAGTLEQYLIDHNTVGLQGIDTRALTRRIRRQGGLRGAIVSGVAYEKEELLAQLRQYTKPAPTPMERTVPHPAQQKYAVAVLEYGCSSSLLQQLADAGCQITLHSPAATLEQVQRADGILLSDGPEGFAHPTAELRRMLEAGLPMLAVGAGHQLLAQAMGFALEALPCGHHGANHPVVFRESGHSVITAQHHGLAVRADSVAADLARISHVNHNDGSVEGLRYLGKPAFSVQFLPSATPAPHGGDTVVQQFCRLMGGAAHA